jgi:phospholipase/carboxylesterase
MSADTKPVVVWRRPAKSGVSTPLVIFLHGRGADENDLIDISERLPRTFAYASVRAPVALEWGGFTWFENRTPPHPPATASVRASVVAFRTWLNDPAIASASETCYLFGFSAGMMMAGALLIDDPQRFAGAVLLSGALVLDGIAEAVPGRFSGLPIFYGRGTEDTVIPPPLVAQAERYLSERSGAELTFREYPIEHTISNRELDDIAEWFGSLH